MLARLRTIARPAVGFPFDPVREVRYGVSDDLIVAEMRLLFAPHYVRVCPKSHQQQAHELSVNRRPPP